MLKDGLTVAMIAILCMLYINEIRKNHKYKELINELKSLVVNQHKELTKMSELVQVFIARQSEASKEVEVIPADTTIH